MVLQSKRVRLRYIWEHLTLLYDVVFGNVNGIRGHELLATLALSKRVQRVSPYSYS